MFVKFTIKSIEFPVEEFHSSYSLYDYLLKSGCYLNLSPYENDEFFMSNVKSVSIDGFELKTPELYFDNLNNLYGGVKLKHGIQTIFKKRICDIIALEIEV